MTLSDVVTAINSERKHNNLSSAVRLFVLDHYRGQPRSDRMTRTRQSEGSVLCRLAPRDGCRIAALSVSLRKAKSPSKK